MEKSPNWDKVFNFINEYPMLEGQMIPGFPFKEGWPNDRKPGHYAFEIILRNGEKHVAQVDLSTQYRAEGLNWITKHGTTHPQQVVAAWRSTDLGSGEHDVRIDYVGISGRRERLTCYTEGCDGATIVCQPYMNNDAWQKAGKEFLSKHPCSLIKNEGYRG